MSRNTLNLNQTRTYQGIKNSTIVMPPGPLVRSKSPNTVWMGKPVINNTIMQNLTFITSLAFVKIALLKILPLLGSLRFHIHSQHFSVIYRVKKEAWVVTFCWNRLESLREQRYRRSVTVNREDYLPVRDTHFSVNHFWSLQTIFRS